MSVNYVLRVAWFALFVAPNILRAQTIRGTVQNESGARVAGALITLLDDANRERASALSDPLGRFEVKAPTEGVYRLRVHRIGFAEQVTDSVAVSRGGITSVRISLLTEAIELEGLKVEVEAPIRTDPYLDRRGFYDRWKHWGINAGFGVFFTREDIQKMNAFHIIDIIRNTSGMKESHLGGRTVVPNCRTGGRPRLFINNKKVKYGDDFEPESCNQVS